MPTAALVRSVLKCVHGAARVMYSFAATQIARNSPSALRNSQPSRNSVSAFTRASRSAHNDFSSSPYSPSLGSLPSNRATQILVTRLTKLPSTSAKSLLITPWKWSQKNMLSLLSGEFAFWLLCLLFVGRISSVFFLLLLCLFVVVFFVFF